MIKTATRALYAMVGAPVVAFEKTMAISGKLTETARDDYDAAVSRGQEVTKKMTATADELGSRVDIEGIQDRVEKLRDQLEDALSHWRENFRPDGVKVAPAASVAPKPASAATTKTAAAKKPAAKASTTKTAAAKKPAARKPAAKASTTKTAAAKKPAAKKPAAKASTTKASTTKTAAAKKPAARKPAARKPAAKAGTTTK